MNKEVKNVENNNITTPVSTEQPPAKKNNKKVFLIVGIIVVVLVVAVVLFLLLGKKDKTKEPDKKSNSNSNSNVVVEKRKGKELRIYKMIDDDGDVYDYVFEQDIPEDVKTEHLATITCKTEDCEPEDAFSNYAVVEEEDGAYLIDLKTDELVYGPFGTKYKPEEDEEGKYFFSYGYTYKEGFSEINAITVDNNKKTDVFYIKDRKEIKNLVGIKYYLGPNSSADVEIDNGYILLYNVKFDADDNGEIVGSYLYNLSDGKLESKYNVQVEAIATSGKVYIKTDNLDKDQNVISYSLKDVKGNPLLNNGKFQLVNTENSGLVVADNNYFYVYDKDLKLIKKSDRYTGIEMIGKDFVLVNNVAKLQLVDLTDNLLATFIQNYNPKKHYVHTQLSGWFEEGDKDKNKFFTKGESKGIYIIVAQNDVNKNEVLKTYPDMDPDELNGVDLGYEYFYIPTTKETGKIPTYIGGYAKPVLYLYPTKTTNIKVGFKHPELLTTTYPKFNNFWDVKVDKNGNITDKKGRNYYGLYWEEISNKKVSFDEGFYVEKDNAIDFLEEKLDLIGLTQREANEFIMYWLPILEKNEKNLVYFELTNERESFNKLLISPKPDSLLRVAIHIKKVNKKVNIKEQKLTKFNRTGFSAVEWGGYAY